MTGSYKMVLIAAAALFLFVVGYYVFQDSSQPDRSVVSASSRHVEAAPANPSVHTAPPRQALSTPLKPTAIPTHTAIASDALAGNADRMAALRAKLARAKPQTPKPQATPTLVFDAKKRDSPVPAPAIAPASSPRPPRPLHPILKPQPRPETPAPSPPTYTVKPGDTLSSIAQKLYDSERRWVDIAQANPTIDPIKLKVGQQLKLPTQSQLQEVDSPRAPAPGATVVYVVRPGDTLSSIAEQYYSKPTLWRVIFNANRDQLGTQPNSIQAGMKLKVPPSPQSAR